MRSGGGIEIFPFKKKKKRPLPLVKEDLTLPTEGSHRRSWLGPGGINRKPKSPAQVAPKPTLLSTKNMTDLNGTEEETAGAPGLSSLERSVAVAYATGSGLGQTGDQVPAPQSESFPSLFGGYNESESDHLVGGGARIRLGNAREPAARRGPHGGRFVVPCSAAALPEPARVSPAPTSLPPVSAPGVPY